MAYSDQPAFRWDRIVGFALGLGAGVILLDPAIALLVDSCFWEAGCESSQAPRFIGACVAVFGLSALVGWLAAALLKRLFYDGAR